MTVCFRVPNNRPPLPPIVNFSIFFPSRTSLFQPPSPLPTAPPPSPLPLPTPLFFQPCPIINNYHNVQPPYYSNPSYYSGLESTGLRCQNKDIYLFIGFTDLTMIGLE